MVKVEVSVRIHGRDLTLACDQKEKDNLLKAAKELNLELEKIPDKNNALILAGLNLANRLVSTDSESINTSKTDYSKLIKKIERALEN